MYFSFNSSYFSLHSLITFSTALVISENFSLLHCFSFSSASRQSLKYFSDKSLASLSSLVSRSLSDKPSDLNSFKVRSRVESKSFFNFSMSSRNFF
ncbi:Uncharacterized protein APZ42_016430 [Daphnia magna]|uniref:Uncharacterized protein n=1 Tax=Daphnia magna TaxID=35525 RepID=A0A165AEK6_9CRUS|nr:Uncharacterized protein APZ42_016430 [Daphnia magna]